jgi:hypothetical protein
MFKIIAKGKIPSISKKVPWRAVFPTFSISPVRMHFWQVVNPFPGRYLCSREIGLQRSHTRIDQKQAFIILWNQRKAFHHQMSLAFKKKSRNIWRSSFTPYFFTFYFLLTYHSHFRQQETAA